MKENQKISAVILSAGYGIRFFPMTKLVAKEFFPFGNRPIIDYAFDELRMNEELESVLCVISKNKRHIKNYFTENIDLENHFKQHYQNKSNIRLENNDSFSIEYEFQKEMKGTGDALLLAKSYLKEKEYFLLIYPDDLLINPIAKELILAYKKYKKSILCFVEKKVNKDLEYSSYGILGLDKILGEKNLYKVVEFIEKPKKITKDRVYISIGRYLLNTKIISLLEMLSKKMLKGKEFLMTDVFQSLIKDDELYAYKIPDGNYFPTGTPIDYMQSITKYTIHHSHYKEKYREFLKKELALIINK